MASPFGSIPEGRQELQQTGIKNKNLPEGFEITEEMLQDPATKFFLEHYQGPIDLEIKLDEKSDYPYPEVLCLKNMHLFQTVKGVFNRFGKNCRVTPNFIDFSLYSGEYEFVADNYKPDNHNRNQNIDDRNSDRLRFLTLFLGEDQVKNFVNLFRIGLKVDTAVSNIQFTRVRLTDAQKEVARLTESILSQEENLGSIGDEIGSNKGLSKSKMEAFRQKLKSVI